MTTKYKKLKDQQARIREAVENKTYSQERILQAKGLCAQKAVERIEARGYDPELFFGTMIEKHVSGKTITYGELETLSSGRVIGSDTGNVNIAEALGCAVIWFWCKDMDPHNMCVVNQGTGECGEGADRMVFEVYGHLY